MAKKKASVEDELEQLKASPDAAGLSRALESRHARVVAAAAAQIKARALDGHAKALAQAFERFLGLARHPGGFLRSPRLRCHPSRLRRLARNLRLALGL